MKITENGRLLTVGIVGLGSRGSGQLKLINGMHDVRVAAVCDQYDDRVQDALKVAVDAVGMTDYRAMLSMPEIEAVFIFTDWVSHISIAVEALRAGKQVAMEVGGASSVEECWRLVHAAEETGGTCMLLENCCYGDVEMALMNMIHQGVFGEIVHCQGAYAHDLRDEIGLGDINRHYRQQNFLHRNGELYPTHELGPIAQYLRLGRGNRMLSLCSMATAPKGLHAWLAKNRPESPLANAQVNEGDIVTTLISCANGQTIVLSHDCTLPRPYSRGGVVRGTKGIWMEDNRSIYIEDATPQKEEDWSHSWESDEKWMKQYRHPLWLAYDEFGARGGHGGMDYLAMRAFIESVQNHTPAPIDVYDTVTLMSITALSEQSVAMGGMPVPIPDFTSGRWIYDKGEKGVGIFAL